MSRARLGVNIDHVATLRQQRDEAYPSLTRAAQEVLEAGAEQITIHLREDRRHIQDSDLAPIKSTIKNHNKLLNLELGLDDEIVDIACKTQADWFCLVPEKREEKTTEGGLNLLDSNKFDLITKAITKLKKESPKSKVSLFLEPGLDILESAISLDIDAVELHTGAYTIQVHSSGLNNKASIECLNKLEIASAFLQKKGLAAHAGHGLSLESLKVLVEKNLFEEYNIGHWIISESIFKGLKAVVKETVAVLDKKLV